MRRPPDITMQGDNMPRKYFSENSKWTMKYVWAVAPSCWNHTFSAPCSLKSSSYLCRRTVALHNTDHCPLQQWHRPLQKSMNPTHQTWKRHTTLSLWGYGMVVGKVPEGYCPVSYTHLDVYKRQILVTLDKKDTICEDFHKQNNDYVLLYQEGLYRRQEWV